MHRLLVALILLTPLALAPAAALAQGSRYYELAKGDFPHDVAAAPTGEVWFAGQKKGIAGRLDPATGQIERIPLGQGSAPHGVIIGPDGAPWFTDGGQNAIVRVDPATKSVKVWPLPPERMPYTNLNTAAFDGKGRIWFTGQNGIYGRLDPATGDMKVWDAPKGRGPYGITGTPRGDIWYVSLAGSYLANVDLETGEATVYEPPTKGQGARRVWSDFQGPAVGERVELRPGEHVRPGRPELEGVEAPRREAAHLRGVGGPGRQGLARRLGRQRDRALRSRDASVSTASRATGPIPTCARCWAAKARRGSPNRERSASASSAPRPRRTDVRLAVALWAAAMLVAVLGCLLAVDAARGAEGDAARGARVFQRCFACHSVDPNETAQLQGPSLHRIMGRPAAAVSGYEYSDAMKVKAAAGLVWTADTLDRFIADPDVFVPGTPMVVLPPLRDEHERADLIAYLAHSALAPP